VACIVCADTDCGIDIEDRLDLAGSPTATKLQRWTATEAALKAAGLGLRAAGEVALADLLGHASVQNERYELQPLDGVPGVIGYIAARKKLTPNVSSMDLDDARMSALLERSFGLATQVE